MYLRKGLEAVVSLYGIMRAGAVYVPLDPFASTARLQQIIQDCDIRWLITEPQCRYQLPTLVAATSLECLVGLPSLPDVSIPCVPWSDVFNMASEREPNIAVSRHDLAYILYYIRLDRNAQGNCAYACQRPGICPVGRPYL